jgi:alkyl hydroperoxide reductase subunit AhpC
MTREFTTTTKLWLTSHSSLGPENLATLNTIEGLSLTDLDMSHAGWTIVGTAEVKVSMISDNDQLVANKVVALRAEAQKIRAEAEAKAVRIEDKIQQLLAITYTPAEVTA